MNVPPRVADRVGRARLILAAGIGALGISVGGCVEIHGGAVEVAWVLFAPGGRAITDCGCASPAVAQVKLTLSSLADHSDPCAESATCRFTCARKTGSTPFNIPPGQYAMSLSALGSDGVELDGSMGFRFPPPATWPVVEGQPTELDALTIEAPCADPCNGESMTEPCARP